jgi:hypothetical protein
MIFRSGRDSSPLESAGPRRPFFGCNTTVLTRVRALVADPNPFAQGKNLSNTGATRLLRPRRNGNRNGGTVTTNHLLLQRQLGKAVALLPISQPNSKFLGCKCTERAEGDGGGPQRRKRQNASMQKRTRNFLHEGLK